MVLKVYWGLVRECLKLMQVLKQSGLGVARTDENWMKGIAYSKLTCKLKTQINLENARNENAKIVKETAENSRVCEMINLKLYTITSCYF